MISFHLKAQDCYGLNMSQFVGADQVRSLSHDLDKVNCLAKVEAYQCQQLENQLSSNDKNKIIKCNETSFRQNNISDLNLGDCVIDGIKISANSLLDLGTMPKKIMVFAINSLQDGEKCYQDTAKKIKMARLFNLGISNPRFLLDENYINISVPKMTCGEIQRNLEARMRVYADQVKREMHGNLINSLYYNTPIELTQNNYGFINKFDQILKDYKIKYECYTPKAKAEMLCAGLTSFVLDAAVGASLLKAGQAIKKIAFSANTYNAQSGLSNLANLSRSTRPLSDVPQKMRHQADELLDKNHYVDVRYDFPENSIGKVDPTLLKEGTTYQLIYQPEILSNKAQDLLSKVKSLKQGENSVVAEINGETTARVIRGSKDIETVAIIGRGHDRVKVFQSGIKSETFSPSKAAVKRLEEHNDLSLMIEENKKWIESVRKRGMTVIDLGMGNAREVGPFYKVELLEMKKYTKDLSN